MNGSARGGVGLLITRVQRRLHRSLWVRQARRHDRDYRGVAGEEFERRLEPAHVAATLPGPLTLPAPSAAERAAAAIEADEILQHRFRLFGALRECAAVESGSRFRQLAQGLPADLVARYRPIEWHTDFGSGFRWDPALHYLDVRVAPQRGADIKVPRELSRFHHVGVLACSSLPAAGDEFVLQVLDWIAANPPRRGVNWASAMDVAIRAVNWIWGLRLFESAIARYPRARAEIRRSLYEHGLHVARNLEYYEECTSNHYLANIAGLVYIGAAFPEFPESDAWLKFGLEQLVSESFRQLYDDGADFEASTHYHRLVIEMFLSCAAVAERLPLARIHRLRDAPALANGGSAPPAPTPSLQLDGSGTLFPRAFYDRLERGVGFTAALTKPNGLVPQFGDNDSARLHKLAPIARDDARDHRHLLAVAGRFFGRPDLLRAAPQHEYEAQLVAGGLEPKPGSFVFPVFFPNAGVAILRGDKMFVAVTCGPNGQNGFGGHGHNDKLSFELNVSGVDFIVDGGCPAYTGDAALRNRFRSTAAHSTIAVDGLEQDVWKDGLAGLFRLPERSSPTLNALPDGRVVGSHQGFGAAHTRTLAVDGTRLAIEDRLPHAGTRVLTWNLAPDTRIDAIDSSADDRWDVTLEREGVRIRMTVEGVARPREAEGFFSTGYGQRVPSTRLTAVMMRDTVMTTIARMDSA